MPDLQALLERVEKATGPDRELDADFYEALGYEIKREPEQRPDWTISHAWAYRQGTRWYSMERLTASIDAALALVEKTLPGWHWHIHDGNAAMLCEDWDDDYAPVFRSQPIHQRHVPFERWKGSTIATPALAILAALFRAKLSLSSDQKP